MNSRAWKAGVATVAITPTEPMWLAGWAARREPASDAAMDLFAKALALEDAAGNRVVIVTADLIAIPATLAHAVAAQVQKACGLARERMLFNASHTHTGPEIRPDKVPFFEIPPEHAAKIAPYVGALEEKLASVILTALGQLEPVMLHAHEAHATFAHNRRAGGGRVDHRVPVLTANRRDGRVLAVMFGYACHNLTLPPGFCRYHGDYAGVAQAAVEQKFPGATALFLAGAGADQDPAPRGTVEWVKPHGTALAEAVAAAVAGRDVSPRRPRTPRRGVPTTDQIPIAGRGIDDAPTLAQEIGGPLAVAFEEITLDLQPLPSPETLQSDARSDDAPRRRKAEFLLAAQANGRPLASTQACPIHVVRLGGELLLIALGGEPVVDFALRFQTEFAGPLVWVAGYSNDMFGYLPTRAVQQEGGYEGGRAALWSALPMPVAESSEEKVIGAVRRLVASVCSPV